VQGERRAWNLYQFHILASQHRVVLSEIHEQSGGGYQEGQESDQMTANLVDLQDNTQGHDGFYDDDFEDVRAMIWVCKKSCWQ